MLRRALEFSSRHIRFTRRLPADFGGRRFLASPEGGLKYFRLHSANIDPMLVNSAKRLVHAGDVVWDVGANVGLFSFAASGLATLTGQVFAIEPDTFMVELLYRSSLLKSPGCAPVEVLPVAIRDTETLAKLNIAARARAANFLSGYGTTQTGGVREERTVVTLSLDWLLKKIPPPQVVKIDSEGTEREILKGGDELLSKHRPRFLCEVAAEHAVEVTKIFFRHGYEIFNAEFPDEPVDLATDNTIALPINTAY